MKAIAMFNYIKFISSFTFIAIISIIIACGPKPDKAMVETKPNVPYALKALADSKSATLSWQINLVDPARISGYNVYLADSPNAEGEQFNSAPYPGDTDGDITKETYEIPRLENGKQYYAYIRTVLSDGSLSAPSGKVAFTPLARGEITISQNYSIDRSGFCFAKEKYTRARDFENDIYIFDTGSKNGISSPSRLHSSLRDTRISYDGGKYLASQPLRKGKTYIVETSNGGHAKLILKDIKGTPPSIEAIFSYIYYPPGLEPK